MDFTQTQTYFNLARSFAGECQAGMRYQYSYEELWQPKNILVTFRMYQLNLDGREERVYRKYWDSSDVHFIEKEPARDAGTYWEEGKCW